MSKACFGRAPAQPVPIAECIDLSARSPLRYSRPGPGYLWPHVPRQVPQTIPDPVGGDGMHWTGALSKPDQLSAHGVKLRHHGLHTSLDLRQLMWI
jgi:hypothetical protein